VYVGELGSDFSAGLLNVTIDVSNSCKLDSFLMMFQYVLCVLPDGYCSILCLKLPT
jgi:hypothetical protein